MSKGAKPLTGIPKVVCFWLVGQPGTIQAHTADDLRIAG